MALNAAIEWELRTTGADTNGGGFKAGASGTDWTQQDAAQYSVTDAVTDGSSTITSATANFGTDVVGNVLYIQGGTAPITAGWYEITTRNSASSITVDRATGLTAGTGATLKIGGAMLTLNAVNAVKVSGNRCHMKAGTYTVTARADWTTSDSVFGGGSPTLLVGYNTTRGDNPKGFSNQPLISCSTAGVDIFGLSGAGVFAFFIQIDGNDTARDGAVDPGTGNSSRGGLLAYCNIKRCTRNGVGAPGYDLFRVRVTDMKAASTDAIRGNGDSRQCVADNNPCPGFGHNGNNEVGFIDGCISAHNTGASSHGFASDNWLATSHANNCVAYSNGGHGFSVADGAYNAVVALTNCVAYGNGGYGIKGATRPALPNVDYNAYGSNTSGNITGYTAGANDVTLTADPYTGAGSAAVAACDTIDDVFALFTPNATAGGGAALRAAGWPPYADIGAVQHQEAQQGVGARRIAIGGPG